jgi:hypothetical protein
MRVENSTLTRITIVQTAGEIMGKRSVRQGDFGDVWYIGAVPALSARLFAIVAT